MDAYICNAWRAIQADPDGVAEWADWPVSELDLHSRHRWLQGQADFIEKLRADPDFFDAKIAGWWLWGICAWIGDGWCKEESNKRPHLGNAGRGINRGSIPHLGDAGRGINRGSIPHLGDAGRGARPHLGRDQGTHAKFRSEGIYEYMAALSERMRRVRVCCGDWTRVLGPSVTTFHGMTAIFLDPPYFSKDRSDVYNHDSRTLPKDVEKWCAENGDNPLLRLALCGYEGDYDMPKSWDCIAWKANGGMGNRNKKNDNAGKERIWFSKFCLKKKQPGLFDGCE